ncbi:CcmA: cytochrome c maturation system, ATP-binding protein [Desulfosarcina variabilis str. Montpellier]|uniref:ABC transporter ATP-binding protein n=1 Tax=Desulfosarcina variabilis TaxID=2300 RepID=UPI003AFA3268
MGTTYSLKVEGLGKHYASTLLFKNISFSLSCGDVLAITGWNGSGKSTLLRIIAGLTSASTGQISLTKDNTAIPKTDRRRYIGLAAPAISLYDELTGLENLAFFCKVRGLLRDRSGHLEMLAEAGLTGQADKPCREYSSGMKQRLKLAQALVHAPPLLLLDEPGANLDSKGFKIVERIVHKQRGSGMTIIASNDGREVAYADRTINLSRD